MLKRDLGLGHGDANTLTHFYFKSLEAQTGKARTVKPDDVLAGIYYGPKAELRLIHDKCITAINKFSPFEIAPKKNASACAA